MAPIILRDDPDPPGGVTISRHLTTPTGAVIWLTVDLPGDTHGPVGVVEALAALAAAAEALRLDLIGLAEVEAATHAHILADF